jgi:hypothetical protein
MLPAPICWPISTPMTCAITAPGPSTGDRNGSPQISESSSSPGMLPASGSRSSASQVPRPVSLMMPISIATKAMNGSTLRMTWSIESRPLWKSTFITRPMPRPKRVIAPVKPPPPMSIWPPAVPAAAIANGLCIAAPSRPLARSAVAPGCGAGAGPSLQASSSAGVTFSGRTPDT